MNTTTKVMAFLVGLAAVFAVTFGVGNAVGPIGTTTEPHDDAHPGSADDEDAKPHGAHDGEAAPATAADIPGGLMVSQDGYTLVLDDPQAKAGRDQRIEFIVTGPGGSPVTDYQEEHEKLLHLIAVRRDFSGFQHVHPTLGATGTWAIDLDLDPGQWRLFADFKPAGADALTLGADLSVAGRVDWAPAPAGDVRTAEVDGYTVTLAGDLSAGEDAELTLSVSKNGQPVTDLQPYLGAYGHLVALREGDLAYLHVHPDGNPGDGRTEPGPEVVFYAAVPSEGDYRLYLDFQHRGVVRTAAFVLSTDRADASRPADASTESDGDGHGDGHGEH